MKGILTDKVNLARIVVMVTILFHTASSIAWVSTVHSYKVTQLGADRLHTAIVGK